MITKPIVYQESTQMVNGFGRIIRERQRWCVEHTVSTPGCIDRTLRRAFASEAEASAYVAELTRHIHPTRQRPA